MFKTLLKILVLFAMMGYLIYAMVVINRPEQEKSCRGLEITLASSQQQDFVTENEIREILLAKKLYLEGMGLDQVDLGEIERTLTATPYIDEAQCYVTMDDKIAIRVLPRIPVLHVLNNKGEDFYIDNKGAIMPRGHHHTDLVLMTGAVSTATAGGLYAPLGVYLAQHDFWNKQIEQIYVTADGDIELTPRVGNHTIVLGDTSKIDDKLHRMQVFYEQGLKKVGWNKYSRISLKFDNQIVCTRRK